ncbi:hypothetical protein DIZ76_010014 [Coccidioides immitis]|nr:hypothetical protein DIZ76_010014 [Coccidioides immitis]
MECQRLGEYLLELRADLLNGNDVDLNDFRSLCYTRQRRRALKEVKKRNQSARDDNAYKRIKNESESESDINEILSVTDAWDVPLDALEDLERDVQQCLNEKRSFFKLSKAAPVETTSTGDHVGECVSPPAGDASVSGDQVEESSSVEDDLVEAEKAYDSVEKDLNGARRVFKRQVLALRLRTLEPAANVHCAARPIKQEARVIVYFSEKRWSHLPSTVRKRKAENLARHRGHGEKWLSLAEPSIPLSFGHIPSDHWCFKAFERRRPEKPMYDAVISTLLVMHIRDLLREVWCCELIWTHIKVEYHPSTCFCKSTGNQANSMQCEGQGKKRRTYLSRKRPYQSASTAGKRLRADPPNPRSEVHDLPLAPVDGGSGSSTDDANSTRDPVGGHISVQSANLEGAATAADFPGENGSIPGGGNRFETASGGTAPACPRTFDDEHVLFLDSVRDGSAASAENGHAASYRESPRSDSGHMLKLLAPEVSAANTVSSRKQGISSSNETVATSESGAASTDGHTDVLLPGRFHDLLLEKLLKLMADATPAVPAATPTATFTQPQDTGSAAHASLNRAGRTFPESFDDPGCQPPAAPLQNSEANPPPRDCFAENHTVRSNAALHRASTLPRSSAFSLRGNQLPSPAYEPSQLTQDSNNGMDHNASVTLPPASDALAYFQGPVDLPDTTAPRSAESPYQFQLHTNPQPSDTLFYIDNLFGQNMMASNPNILHYSTQSTGQPSDAVTYVRRQEDLSHFQHNSVQSLCSPVTDPQPSNALPYYNSDSQRTSAPDPNLSSHNSAMEQSRLYHAQSRPIAPPYPTPNFRWS